MKSKSDECRLLREGREVMGRTGDQIKERRAARMRLGQATAEIVSLLSDPEMQVAIVPLTEGEYQKALDVAAAVDAPENTMGILAREERQKAEMLSYACREVDDFTQRAWNSGERLAEGLDQADVNHLWDIYMEMVSTISPSILGLGTEEFEAVKKALQTMDWNELSGTQWWALERFLLSISPILPTDSRPGSSSTKPSIEKNKNDDLTQDASES
jgi:hypothetical protein